MTPEEFKEKLRELKVTALVLDTGMPQSTESERRATRAKFDKLERDLSAASYYEDERGNIRPQGFGRRVHAIFSAVYARLGR